MSQWNYESMVPNITMVELATLLPAMVLLLAAILALLLAAIFRSNPTKSSFWCLMTAVIGVFISFICIPIMDENNLGDLASMLSVTHGFKGVFGLVLISSLVALNLMYVQDQVQKFISEIYALILFALLGIYFLVFSNHLIFLFTGLEMMSLSVYVMVSLRRTSALSAEAGLKYFILGGLSACFILYGSVLLFGATGTFIISDIAAATYAASAEKLWLIKVAGVLIFSGLFFKVGAVPFHSWVPDIYQGSPASLSGWMSSVVKMASFALMVKVVTGIFFAPNLFEFSSLLIMVVATLTILVGNFLALQQHQLKRLFAYSSVAHTGYLLVALLAAGANPKSLMALFIYLFFYSLLSLASFGVLAVWETFEGQDISIEQLSGLGQSQKVPAFILAVSALGLAGIPLTVGFVGKFLLLTESLAGRQVFLSLMLILGSLIGAYYYLRLIYIIYLRPSFKRQPQTWNKSFWWWSPAAFLTGINIVAGLFPQLIIPWLSSNL